MTRARRIGIGALATAVCLAGAGVCQAQVARVFVSVSGSDGNVCSDVNTPCRSFAAGISQVDSGGEVIVLTTGSYGGVTIGKSVKINVPSGIVAFTAFPITINAGVNDVVVLRGLTIKALNPGTGTGVTFTAGAALHIENCVIDGWDIGLQVNGAGEMFVKDSIVRNVATSAITFGAGGITASIEGSRFENGSNRGIRVLNGARATLKDSVLSGFLQESLYVDGIGSELSVDKALLTHNLVGLNTISNGTARIANSIVTNNTTAGLRNEGGGGTLVTWGNNSIRGNTMDTSGTITTLPPQ